MVLINNLSAGSAFLGCLGKLMILCSGRRTFTLILSDSDPTKQMSLWEWAQQVVIEELMDAT
jgi:hypothetical protein